MAGKRAIQNESGIKVTKEAKLFRQVINKFNIDVKEAVPVEPKADVKVVKEVLAEAKKKENDNE